MKFWTMMEWSLGELDEILDYDGVELPALCHQQHGSRKLGTASLSPMSAKNNAFLNTKAETSVPIYERKKISLSKQSGSS
jgi:hypothetical protein